MSKRKSHIRQWMEAIRECILAKGAFSANRAASKHKISKGFSTCMREMGLISKPTRGYGSVWVGERPRDEKELLALSKRVMEYTLSRQRILNEIVRVQPIEVSLRQEPVTRPEPQAPPTNPVRRIGLIRRFVQWIY